MLLKLSGPFFRTIKIALSRLKEPNTGMYTSACVAKVQKPLLASVNRAANSAARLEVVSV